MLQLIAKFLPFYTTGFIFVDILTGMSLHSIGSSLGLSVGYKLVFIFLCFFVLINANRQAAKIVTTIFLIICLYLILYLFFYGEKYFSFQFFEVFKLFSLFIVAYGLIESYKVAKFSDKAIRYFYIITIVVFSANVSLGFFGVGFMSYGTYGFKGFFYSGNSMSGIVAIISVYVLNRTYKVNKRMYIASFLLLLYLAYLIGTKSGILSVLIAAFILPLQRLNVKKFAIIILGVLTFITFIYLNLNQIQNSDIFNRLQFMYERGGLLTLILSGRDEFFNILIQEYIKSDVFGFLLGLDRNISESLEHAITEMDVSDIIIFMGIPITVCYVICMFLLFNMLKRNMDRDIFYEISVTSILLIFIGLISGHVLMNGVIVPYWGSVLAFGLARSNNKYENCNINNSISV